MSFLLTFALSTAHLSAVRPPEPLQATGGKPAPQAGSQQGTGSGQIPRPSGAQRGGPTPGSREAMWPAPTAEDWAKPVQIQWQRTWEDAVAVSRETGKPIMIAVNMDGEIASEHYAGIRYRDPEVGKLFEPYVSVIASVYRHNPRDYDENGDRIPCPRFGCVTCGEHIAMEPLVYSMYLDETRVAPRHIGVELDGTEYYDVFYAFDVKSVLDAWREGIENRENTEKPGTDDKSLEELVASRDARDRVLIEKRFRKGERRERARLLEISSKLGAGAPVELLRLALFGLDVEVASQARKILAEQRSEAAIDLIAEALGVPMPPEERDMLIGALEEMGKEYPRARSLSVTLRGLDAVPEGTEVAQLASALAATPEREVAVARYELEARIEGSLAEPAESPVARGRAELERAEATLRLAVDPEALQSLAAGRGEARRFTELRFRDAIEAAKTAEGLGVRNWRSDAVIGIASYYLDVRDAGKPTWPDRMVSAYESMTSDESAADNQATTGWIGMATLSLFTDARIRSIGRAARANREWPREWMTEVNTAFDLLARHPLGTDEQVAKHHDFLVRMGAGKRAFDALTRGLDRFEGSWALHARLRDRLLRSKGVTGLQASYAKRKGRPGASATAAWYAGYAGLVAGEFRRRRSQSDEAAASYRGAIADFEEAVRRDPTTRPTSEHYAAMALAGMAAVELERDELLTATTLLVQSFERWPDAANALDGMNASAVTTSNLVMARLKWAGLDEAADTLQAARDALDPRLLAPPAFETPPDTPAARNRDRRGRLRRDRDDGGR
ncbi:MAG: hypothetical protein AAGB93_11450 [Planctomycetota bacterium]